LGSNGKERTNLGVDIRSRSSDHIKSGGDTSIEEGLVSSETFEIQDTFCRVVETPVRVERDLQLNCQQTSPAIRKGDEEGLTALNPRALIFWRTSNQSEGTGSLQAE
jgi:hypothetical protein